MHDSDKKDILLHLLLKTEAGKMLEWLKRHAWNGFLQTSAQSCTSLHRFDQIYPQITRK